MAGVQTATRRDAPRTATHRSRQSYRGWSRPRSSAANDSEKAKDVSNVLATAPSNSLSLALAQASARMNAG